MKLIKKYKIIIIFVLIFIIFNIPLPYYVDAPGGIENVNKNIKISGYDSKGSLNIVYVKEFNTNIPMILYSLLRKDYDIIKKTDVVLETESINDYEKRDKLLMDESISNAIYVAYTKANKKIEILDNKIYVLYNENKYSDLKVLDEIISINNDKVTSKEDIEKILKDTNENVKIQVINNKKKYVRNVKLTNDKKLGILISNIKKYNMEPNIKIDKDNNQSGPSGGLMIALYIYNKLTKDDITKGKKIVGTGTIETDGTVGEIGGVKYKLKSAVKSKADLFLVPQGDNCKEVNKLIKKEGYNIKIKCVSTFDEVLGYLRSAN